MVGPGEPRGVQGAVVAATILKSLGLRPSWPSSDSGLTGADAPVVIVLTHRFWSTVYKKDPSVIGKIRFASVLLGDRLRPYGDRVSMPSVGRYPVRNAETIWHDTLHYTSTLSLHNHLVSRALPASMTERFGKARSCPGATARRLATSLRTVSAAMGEDHPESYPRRRVTVCESPGMHFAAPITYAPHRSTLLAFCRASGLGLPSSPAERCQRRFSGAPRFAAMAELLRFEPALAASTARCARLCC